MNLQEKITWMESKKSKNMDLDDYREIMDQYLPYHKKLKKIQVAGTNGKGSTCRWMALMLEELGYQVGVFTSPHLIVHNERIQINETMISDSDLERLFDQYQNIFIEHKMTMFEMDLFLAIAYFLEKRVDYAIIEVGLGGRLDATTALDYDATVLTNVGLEHTEILGDTIEKIAQEKSGIFKPGVLAVCGEDKPSAQHIIEQNIRAKRAPFYYTYLPEYKKVGKKYWINSMDGILVFDQPFYQIKNFILACDTLYHLGFRLRYNTLQNTIDRFVFLGRCMVLRKRPLLVVDGAHNLDGINALVTSLKTWQGDIYFSVLKEKDAKHMLDVLISLQGQIHLVNFSSYRLYPLETLGFEVLSMEEMEKRLQVTHQRALVCGSLYFVGEVLKWFNSK
ncbi:bifunctional folylpolyglutamate synthase/dihydrofolate synthase [Faecalicoccus pleomorphus]|uniref:bifunctional folylpolyglutamate synthase/dihydrofolate synthase n=1 Tax=Faecalicoccus pleomorphus TaxID=1323 RepID=UPI00258FA7E2|nr:Mur ligase family protein [Faecalicoccus pleomorphus]MDM8292151.1 Mur ligase family protein [Faecalicoccus pleomorphus]